MADDARQSLPDLERAATLSESFDFFELLRRLERQGGLFGHSGRPDRLGVTDLDPDGQFSGPTSPSRTAQSAA